MELLFIFLWLGSTKLGNLFVPAVLFLIVLRRQGLQWPLFPLYVLFTVKISECVFFPFVSFSILQTDFLFRDIITAEFELVLKSVH